MALHRGTAVASRSQYATFGNQRYGGLQSMTSMQRYSNPSDGQEKPFETAAAVAEFHKAFNLPMRQLPSTDIEDDLAKLRVALLEEEVGEFVTAAEKGDLIGLADALADIAYVVYGTALTYGIDLDSVLQEVHRSNMSKLAADGRPLIREDGKVLKSEQYFPPNIASVLGLQDC
jgi:predicted HAD superfamily Cof-like phosphohydrolase